MERVYGKEMGAWVDAFLKDLNGVGSGERELTSNLLRNVKSAAVGWNLRTAIQQPTAYFRAAAEIDPKYLGTGIETDGFEGRMDAGAKIFSDRLVERPRIFRHQHWPEHEKYAHRCRHDQGKDDK